MRGPSVGHPPPPRKSAVPSPASGRGVPTETAVAPLILLLQVPESWLWPTVWALVAYAVWVLVLAVRGVQAWLRDNPNGARGWWAGAVSLMAIAGVLKLSADALVAACP